ncbi:2',3'-cyclic-nucleotide 3'-phosphodiesterase [Cyclopterus lumpus]|uniref:2',3'-cyclic-nucleotide 3'-phosphodiesterase n=1 Tax=Cyclopterus lumpus TaxID=8103 RepID=A0A8C2ZUU2_CYCLU|nr:2',3'-cyclic-nucleotide 3'-phosphodiesterase [Cyclopterus lumpus]
MDTEQRAEEVLDSPETPQREEAKMETEVVSKVEAQEDFTESEKAPAAGEDAEQLAVNGHDTEVPNRQETEELIVALSEEMNEMEIEDVLPGEKDDVESVPAAVAPPDSDESSEKISDPAAETESMQPVPENDPEPLPVQTPLTESTPEPEKLAELVPQAELQDQTLPALQPPVDAQPPGQEEKGSEQVGTETELQTPMDTGAEEVSKEVAAEPTMEAKEEEKPAETVVLAAEAASAKPTETVILKEEATTESVALAKDEKETEAAEGVESEKIDAEPQKEEDAVPTPGSLSFALLEQEQTKDALRTSRTLVVLKGLPGSGKSFLARAIADAYKGHCSVFCADDHGVKLENPESSVEGYQALDEAVVACCSAGTASSVLMVVDDTNHTQDRLARLGEIAMQQSLVVVFLEPRTEWSRDPAQLSKKNKRGLEEAQLEAMRGSLEEMSIPLYFGWFLLSSIQDKVRCTSMDFLKTLDTLEAFKKHLIDFTGKAEKEVDLEQYFQAKGTLHCTTEFCDYGKVEGSKEYANNPAVKESYGSAFELSLSALFVTPRTVGARVSLSEEQLLLWPADAEKEGESASLPLGSRAHVTLGCAEGVEPVQTGLDLLQILALQQEGQQGELIEEMELGSLTYYGEGRWLLGLREPICAPACFSSFYGRKELDPTKKEPEKKKKPKCAIL